MKSRWMIILLLVATKNYAWTGEPQTVSGGILDRSHTDLIAHKDEVLLAVITAGSVLDRGTGELLEQRRQEYAKQEARQEALALQNAAMNEELHRIYSKDPWRKIGETTNFARGNGWVEFQGKVESATLDGAVFRGKWGPVLSVFTEVSDNNHYISKSDSNAEEQHKNGKHTYGSSTVNDSSFQRKILYGDDLFFVEDFPYPASSNEEYEKMLAFDSTYYSYTNSTGQLLTIHKLIYGRPCAKIWSAEEIATAKQKADFKKKTAQDKLLKSYQDMASRNDPYGLLRLGQCYRDGENGLDKDLVKARSFLQKAADAGSPTAVDELSRLPQ